MCLDFFFTIHQLGLSTMWQAPKEASTYVDSLFFFYFIFSSNEVNANIHPAHIPKLKWLR